MTKGKGDRFICGGFNIIRQIGFADLRRSNNSFIYRVCFMGKFVFLNELKWTDLFVVLSGFGLRRVFKQICPASFRSV